MKNLFRSLLAIALLLAFASVAHSAGSMFTNSNSAIANEVWMYKRANNGQLTLAGTFATQGLGTGLEELGSQGAVALALNNKVLYAVNGGSNEITAFQVKSNGLVFVGKYPSGGTFPNSVTAYGNYLYVLNAKGAAANITAFRIRKNGALIPLPNSTRPLSTDLPSPIQISFTPDGTGLIVTEKISDLIDTYSVGADGLATGPIAHNSAGSGPFGFAFDNAGHMVVSEVTMSAASSYSVAPGGEIHLITGKLKDLGRAACWTAVTNNPAFPHQYAYITNTRSDTVSGYTIAADGSISLLNPADGITALLPAGSFPLDDAISADSKYLYVLEQKLPGITGFQINSDGSLVQIQDLRGTPTTAWGLIGF